MSVPVKEFSADPGGLGERWMDLMRQGDFEGAWRISDQVRAEGRFYDRINIPRHQQSIWDGKPLVNDKVLIHCYHGLGDTIQFIRYLPLVRKIASGVGLCVQPELIPLLQTMPLPTYELMPLHDRRCDYMADVEIEVMELPYAFRTIPVNIPSRVPYFEISPTRLLNQERLNVGLVWQVGDWDPDRSIPFDLIRELAISVDLSWHIIQRGPGLLAWDGSFGQNSGNDDLLEAARVIAALDLLITVDSMPAHLAGALGVPTWILLRNQADWRWFENGSTSPWYPTVRLFRQPTPGDWRPVIHQVIDSLQKLANKIQT